MRKEMGGGGRGSRGKKKREKKKVWEKVRERMRTGREEERAE